MWSPLHRRNPDADPDTEYDPSSVTGERAIRSSDHHYDEDGQGPS